MGCQATRCLLGPNRAKPGSRTVAGVDLIQGVLVVADHVEDAVMGCQPRRRRLCGAEGADLGRLSSGGVE